MTLYDGSSPASHPAPARARGGPLDGAMLGDKPVDRYEVVMADGTTHVYVRTDDVDGAGTSVFRWSGRA